MYSTKERYFLLNKTLTIKTIKTMKLRDRFFAGFFAVCATGAMIGILYLMTNWYTIVDFFLY